MSNDNAQAGVPQTSGKATCTSIPIPPIRLWALVLAAGVLAGFASWYVGEAVDGYFKPALSGVALMGTVTQRSTEESEAVAVVKNAGLVFAILGAALGAALGMAGGLARGNGRAAVGASVAGLLLGSGVGFLAARCVVPVYQWAYHPLSQSLMVPLLGHIAIWSAVGAAGGLAFGVGLGGRSTIARGLLGGLFGALLGTVLFELIGAAVFPLDRTFQPISVTSNSRMLARLCVTLFAAAGAAVVIQVSPGHRSSKAPTSPSLHPNDVAG